MMRINWIKIEQAIINYEATQRVFCWYAPTEYPTKHQYSLIEQEVSAQIEEKIDWKRLWREFAKWWDCYHQPGGCYHRPGGLQPFEKVKHLVRKYRKLAKGPYYALRIRTKKRA